MLVLRNIVKDYDVGDSHVRALNGISIDFRKNEFVSILGPSGCGKTTLLNIIGGLDQYTSGDLVINGVSTKRYGDADWDTYRNHSIGFVFQSYNLIPHQTVLANVELALTLSGISKRERRARAIDALRQVGLENQIKKRPNQMSGGQMQRVAIARALVNDPDILLADEPTGALDTQTSVQIMEILRKISKKKLIIMVTHNPELAKEYSTRIIRVLDGRLVSDSNPYRAKKESSLRHPLGGIVKIGKREVYEARRESEARHRAATKKHGKKRSMSFFTALSLSLNNLMTKKARTFMTSFAGSIGIIGIALILSVSTGVNNYINSVQRDTLSTYPLTIQKETQDYSAMFAAMTEVKDAQNAEIDPNKIYVDDSMGSMVSAMSATTTNNLVKFKEYLDANYDKIQDSLSDVQYTYDFDLQIFTADGKTQVSPTTIFKNMGGAFSGIGEMMESMGGMSSMGFNVLSEMINNQELLDEQYELVGDGSHWPENPNEVVLVVGKNNQISKMTLYMLGVLDQSELEGIMNDLMTEGKYDTTPIEPYDLSDFLGREFLLLNTSDFYAKREGAFYTVDDKEYPIWYDLRDGAFDQESFVTENGTKIVISGIVRPREGATATSISGAIGYTKGLTDYILEQNTKSEVLKQQKETPNHNVLSGLSFERVPYTRENIQELIDKVDAATMEQLYAYMTQQILQNPEFAGRLQVNSKETFLGFFTLMPSEYRTELLSAMMGIAKQNDPNGQGIGTLMMLLSQFPNSVTVTEKDFIKLLPVLSTEQILVALSGMPESQTEFNGQTITIPATKGLIELCGEEAMQAIYAGMTERLKTLTITEESFALLLQGNFIPDDQFVQMEEMLYKLAPQTDATYDSVLKKLGDAEKASPASINFYAKDFESKDTIEAFIKDYNNGVEEVDQLKYTDIVGVMMSSVTTIINAISYVLIAFVAISLVVSSIMIGIITYISVLERTKEIGILRAIGASKKDIRRVFNAETLIVGFVAGFIGIAATLGFNVIINIILYHYTGIANLKAALPAVAAVVLVVISMLLTTIAGLFPSGVAAKRNPVEALRSD